MISENYYSNYNQEKERKVTIEALEAMETLHKYCKTHPRCAACPFSIKGECFLRQGYEPTDWTVGQLVN